MSNDELLSLVYIASLESVVRGIGDKWKTRDIRDSNLVLHCKKKIKGNPEQTKEETADPDYGYKDITLPPKRAKKACRKHAKNHQKCECFK